MIKHKVIKDFQLLTSEKKIIILKSGSIIEDYKLVNKTQKINIEKDIIDNNPEYFQSVDWKQELILHLKQNKIPQPAIISKKLIPFIEESFILNNFSNLSLEKHIEDKEKILNKKEIEILEKEQSLNLREDMIRKKEEIQLDKELEFSLKEEKINDNNINSNFDIDIYKKLNEYFNTIPWAYIPPEFKFKMDNILSDLQKVLFNR